MQPRLAIVALLLALGGCCLDVGGLAPGEIESTGTTGGGSTGGFDAGPLVTTLAGNGVGGFADGTGGPSGTAEFAWPWGVAVDAAGNVYVADFNNNRIRKIAPGGNVTTLAGNGAQGYADGTGGPTGTAEFQNPTGVTVDMSGNVYVADGWNDSIRKIDASANVTTVAGNPNAGYTPAGVDGTGGPNGTATFGLPHGIVWAVSGNLFVGDYDDYRARKIDPGGNVTTLAGNGVEGFADGTAGRNGAAEFNLLWGVAVDVAGNVYVADTQNNRIRMIDPSATTVTTVAGNGAGSYADGSGGPDGSAEFFHPTGIAAQPDGTLYVADSANNRIRKIDVSGNVTTIAGNGAQGFADGSGGANGTASFNGPLGIAVDTLGNLYVSHSSNNRIRKIRASP